MSFFLKKYVIGTAIEPMARWLWGRLGIAKRRVKKLIFGKSRSEQYDAQTGLIMSKVLNSNSNCIDVGCHRGVILELIIKSAPSGRHMGFEPIPMYAEALKERFPDVEISNVALSNKIGFSTFNYVKNRPAYSGIRKRSYPIEDVEIEEIQVELDMLDNLVPSGQKIDLLKIDVEGGELDVLHGAERLILENRPYILFEHGRGASEYYSTTPNDVYSFLVRKCNLNISTMGDWLVGRDPLSIDEFVSQYEDGVNYFFIAYP